MWWRSTTVRRVRCCVFVMTTTRGHCIPALGGIVTASVVDGAREHGLIRGDGSPSAGDLAQGDHRGAWSGLVERAVARLDAGPEEEERHAAVVVVGRSVGCDDLPEEVIRLRQHVEIDRARAHLRPPHALVK